MRKFAFLINPIAGTREKTAAKNIIVEKTKARGIPFEILATNAKGDYSDLRKKIAKEKITDIVVIGGDGTISAVAGDLLDVDVNFGIIPFGSGNGLALAAKIPVNTTKALDIVFDGKASRVDGFFINKSFSCMLCGIGFDAQVAHDFSKAARRGLQTYIKISAINFFKAKPFSFCIESKEVTINTEAFFVCVANSNQFGNNFTIAPQASLKDGLLDIVIVKKMNKFMLPFSVLSQVTGINALQHLNDYVDKKNILYFQTNALVINNEDEAPLHIDGDPKSTSSRFEIKVKPKAFKLLQPVS